jgi:hypothetical protein
MKRTSLIALILAAAQFTGCSQETKTNQALGGDAEPSQAVVSKAVTSWFNSLTVEFFGNKLSPTTAADLVDVRVKERKGDETVATILCDLVFKMKTSYEGGRDKTPMCLLVNLGFENSPGKSNEVKTLQHSFLFEKDEGRWQLQTYRDLKREDGIQFGAYVDSMAFSFGGPAFGTLRRFGLVDSEGKFIDLELVDTNFTGGVIKTKQFGDIHATSSGPSSMSYAATEAQIRKLRKFLAEQAEKTAASPKQASFEKPPAKWPPASGELAGDMEVRVKNPNDFRVRVGLRSAGKGKDFVVSANGTESVHVPNGQYDIYFHYSSDPDGLYQGDSFTLNDNGVEIQIVKVVNGNYEIRKIK